MSFGPFSFFNQVIRGQSFFQVNRGQSFLSEAASKELDRSLNKFPRHEPSHSAGVFLCRLSTSSKEYEFERLFSLKEDVVTYSLYSMDSIGGKRTLLDSEKVEISEIKSKKLNVPFFDFVLKGLSQISPEIEGALLSEKFSISSGRKVFFLLSEMEKVLDFQEDLKKSLPGCFELIHKDKLVSLVMENLREISKEQTSFSLGNSLKNLQEVKGLQIKKSSASDRFSFNPLLVSDLLDGSFSLLRNKIDQFSKIAKPADSIPAAPIPLPPKSLSPLRPEISPDEMLAVNLTIQGLPPSVDLESEDEVAVDLKIQGLPVNSNPSPAPKAAG